MRRFNENTMEEEDVPIYIHKSVGLMCKICETTSAILDEVCYWDINGFPYKDELEMERNGQNPDALAHVLCNDCAENFNFNN